MRLGWCLRESGGLILVSESRHHICSSYSVTLCPCREDVKDLGADAGQLGLGQTGVFRG